MAVNEAINHVRGSLSSDRWRRVRMFNLRAALFFGRASKACAGSDSNRQDSITRKQLYGESIRRLTPRDWGRASFPQRGLCGME